MRVQLEASSKLKELSEVHGAWLPTWLVNHITHIQELAETNWNEHAKPALVIVLQKASEMSEHVHKWAGPHLHAAKTKWIPAAKEQLVVFKYNVEPYWQKISAKSIEVYKASWSAIEPHVVKVQELTDPYLQQAKPYINQVVHATKPHFEKVQVLLLPYKEHVAHASGKFLKTARTYHSQVQANIHERLKKHELTKPHATKEVAWFMASASLAFPVFFLYRLLSAIFCKKARKPRQNAHASQKPRRPKRRHAEK
ncbi:uncharacterized protein M6B38_404920 [Iris pallida]|nr:uncharacterized protein M6B38_404920 [Iris pallida]